MSGWQGSVIVFSSFNKIPITEYLIRKGGLLLSHLNKLNVGDFAASGDSLFDFVRTFENWLCAERRT